MEPITLTGRIRKDRGKGASRQLRRNGRLPGVLYGSGSTQPVSLDLRTIKNLFSSGIGENIIFQFNLEGEDKKERHVLIREIQIHPATRDMLHVDLHEVSMDKKVVVDVPIVLTGEAAGVTEGSGILHHQLRNLSLECLPAFIPEIIEVDISGLHLGETIHAKDLRLAEGLKVLTDPEETVVSITSLAKEEAPAEEAPVEEAPAEEAPVKETPVSGEG